MKYELTETEKDQINKGQIFTHACYTPRAAALCEYVGNYYSTTKFKYEKSSSPTGKTIYYIFFFYPDTFYNAFRIGGMLEREDLYEKEIVKLEPAWVHKFPSVDAKTNLATA